MNMFVPMMSCGFFWANETTDPMFRIAKFSLTKQTKHSHLCQTKCLIKIKVSTKLTFHIFPPKLNRHKIRRIRRKKNPGNMKRFCLLRNQRRNMNPSVIQHYKYRPFAAVLCSYKLQKRGHIWRLRPLRHHHSVFAVKSQKPKHSP